MRVDVYGRELEIQRDGDDWRVFDVGNEGKKRPARDIRIPASIEPGQIAEYLGDLLHEYASARHPDIRIIE